MVIEYELISSESNLEIILIDAAGRLVSRWHNSILQSSSGRHRISGGWNGRNMADMKVSPGIYLLYLKIDNDIKSSWVMAIQ